MFLVLVGCTLLPLDISAQLESTWWYFGDAAGLNFQNGSPVANLSSSCKTGGGAATMSDSAGNLLFYFCQDTIWNSNHEPMLNGTGLLTQGSSEQSTVAVPRPLEDGQFYVFTTDYYGSFGANSGLFYHLIDMSLNGGLGDVVEAVKNVVLINNTEEKIAATKHANGLDYWVMVAECGGNEYHAFLVTESGVNPTPVTTSIGFGASGSGCQGTLRFNHRGDMLAYQSNGLIILDFNNATGELSNDRSFPSMPGIGFGLEFSADDTKLYTGRPMQFDVTLATASAIEASMVQLSSGINTMRGLQYGLDGKIYGVNWYGSLPNGYMAAINNPNQAGLACGYQDSAVYLEGRIANVTVPTFPSDFFTTNFKVLNNCVGDTTFFNINYHFIDSVFWDFGDPGSGAANTDTALSPWHIYSTPGSYNVTLIAQNGAVTDTVVKTIYVKTKPIIDLGQDQELCAATLDSVKLGLDGKTGSYIWSTSSTDSTIWVSSSGSYSLIFSNECGSDSDMVNIVASSPLGVTLPSDTSLCIDSILLEPSVVNENGLTTFLWSTTTTARNEWAKRSSESEQEFHYKLVVSNACGSDSAEVTIKFLAYPDGYLPPDSVYCSDNPFYLLNNQSLGITYRWNDGSDGPDYRVSESGTYWLRSASECDTLVDTFRITFNGQPKIDLGSDTILCPGEELMLVNLIGDDPKGQTYLWNNGITDSNVSVTVNDQGEVMMNGVQQDSTLITVTVTLDACSFEDEVNVRGKGYCPGRCKPQIPNVITPNGDGVNDVFRIAMDCQTKELELYIYNRWGQLVSYSDAAPIPSWDGYINGQLASQGVYYYVLQFTNEQEGKQTHRGYVHVD